MAFPYCKYVTKPQHFDFKVFRRLIWKYSLNFMMCTPNTWSWDNWNMVQVTQMFLQWCMHACMHAPTLYMDYQKSINLSFHSDPLWAQWGLPGQISSQDHLIPGRPHTVCQELSPLHWAHQPTTTQPWGEVLMSPHALFTNVPLDEAFDIIQHELEQDPLHLTEPLLQYHR